MNTGDWAADLESAEGCFNHIRNIFSEISDYRFDRENKEFFIHTCILTIAYCTELLKYCGLNLCEVTSY